MNPNYDDFNFPILPATEWSEIFENRKELSHDIDAKASIVQAIDLVSKVMKYQPFQRLKAIEALCHPFF